MSNVLELFLNYFFIQFSILLFIAPFYVVYLKRRPGFPWRHRMRTVHAEAFFGSKEANWMVFIWAATEAICWFVIPEFLLLLIIFVRVRDKRTLLLSDIGGTFLGTIVGLVIAFNTHFNVASVPYITPQMVAQVHAWYSLYGSFALFLQPFSGVPYKVFVISAPSFAVSIPLFVFLSVVARVARYYILFLIFTAVFPYLHRFVSKNYVPLFLVSCFVFSLLLSQIYFAYGSQYHVKYARGESVEVFMENIHKLLPG